MAATSAEKGCSPGRLGAFTFIRSRGSLRKQIKRQHSRCEGDSSSGTSGTIGRWLRELRSTPRDVRQTQSPTTTSTTTTTTRTIPTSPSASASERIDRANPVYHSEGKGLRKRKDRDRRRHSFNEQQGDQQVPRQATSWFTNGRPPSERRSMARDAPSSGSRHLMTSLGPAAGRATTATHLRNHHLAKPQEPKPQMPSIYSYLPRDRDDSSPPPTPPVRDASSLKALRYGPGHEKFPSWPVPASQRPTSGGSHRSKSWTEQTSYPKEPSQPYTRPYMKRTNPHFTQQLMTVMERCEKIPAETFETSLAEDSCQQYQLPRLDRDGKLLGDSEYSAPSPPERDKPHSPLTQAELDQYTRNYHLEDYMRVSQEAGPQVQIPLKSGQQASPTSGAASLTQADLEEYARVYEDSLRGSSQHVHQASYAHSEGYHSYVSSSDSTTTTPFLDRLRRDSEVGPCSSGASAGPQTGPRQHWACSSAASSGIGAEAECEESSSCGAGRESSSGSASSSETLKWHGSISDLSVASSATAVPHSSSSSRQLIAHSARVQTPQRHHSESVLYLGGQHHQQQQQQAGWQNKIHSNNQQNNKLRLFPVNTYTVEPHHTSRTLPLSVSQTKLSVADRISELEKQQSQHHPQHPTRYTYLDPEKKLRVSDPTLKAIQKKALLSFYERHQHGSSWRSEPHLASAQPQTMLSSSTCQGQVPPQPPPRPRASTGSMAASRRGSWRELASTREITSLEMNNLKDSPRHQYSSSCGSLATETLGPLIVGPSISIDDWVPERPPKKPHLRAPASIRGPSPDLPPPPSPTPLDELPPSDEPLPPPPPEVATPWRQDSSKNHTHKLLVNGKLAVEDSFRPPPRRPRCSGGAVEGKLRPLGLSLPPSIENSGIGGISGINRSTSKASYLASRREQRERGLPNFEGSYKQTVSPHGLSTLSTTPSTATVTRSQTIGPSPGLHKFASSPAISIPLNHSPPLSLNSHHNNNNNNIINNVNNNKSPSPPCSWANNTIPEKPSSPVFLKSSLATSQIPLKDANEKKEKSPEPEQRCPPQSSPRLVDSASHSPTPSSSSASSTSASSSSSSSTCSPPPSGAASPARVDSLRLMQRSEIVLRVAPPTSDAASQTDCVETTPPASPPATTPRTTPTPTTPSTTTTQSTTSTAPIEPVATTYVRQKLEEELECERLSKDLASQLSPSDKLQGLLVQGPDHKRPSDYVAGLFRLEITPRSGRLATRALNSAPSSNSGSPPPSSGAAMSNGVNGSAAATQTEEPPSPTTPTSTKEETALPSNSAYFTTSESKARFLARYSRDIQAPLESTNDLNQKKEELMSRLDRKLDVLRGEHLVVTEESRLNEELGATVAAHVTRAARPHESAKYRLHVEEVGKITSLLLGLSGRLARAENALCGLPSDHADRPILESKRDKLLEQLEEAKKLKENIDRRSVSVANILNKYFTPEEYTDYDHFIHMKAKLIMDSREIADKIKLGEEQLAALRETLSK